jgi:uncharacterized damage-inducible protein DinB
VNDRLLISGPVLAALLRKGYSSDPWHGPSTVDLLRDVPFAAAAAQPFSDGHSIWDIVLHMTSWHREVTRRLAGAPPEPPEDGDWPALSAPDQGLDQGAWDRARAELGASLEQLAAAVSALSDDDLRELVGSARDRALGAGISRAEMVAGVLQHDAYHSGQIALLRKTLRE